MAKYVDTAWIAEKLDDPNYLLIDPRRPMKYLSGHLKNAVNLPAYKAFDPDLRLLPTDALSTWIGNAGLDDTHTPVLYDSFDGQNAGLTAWILEYLGRTDVYIMNAFYDLWLKQNREVFYKPVDAIHRTFTARVKPAIRTTADVFRNDSAVKLIDFRSLEEFDGTRDTDGKPGHIPGARNIVWRDLVTPEGFFAGKDRLDQLFRGAGLKPGDTVVSYCRSGIRASVGYLALKEFGCNVKLYDGSYHDWVKQDLPVEK